MSDPTLNYYIAKGTNAERTAFTPNPATPAAGPDPSYIFYETDTGNTYMWDGSAWNQINTGSGGHPTRAITCVMDGGGAEITTGIKARIYVPYNCTITAVTMLADQTGNAVVDIWKDSYANYPPTIADTIVASAPPTISGSNKSQDNTLTGWTTSISAGDTLIFNLDSITNIEYLVIVLTVTL